MALFLELNPDHLDQAVYGEITAVEPDSVADDVGILPGDQLLAINDHSVEDIIDVQFYSADETLELLIRRGEELLLFEAERAYGQTLGLIFDHPTFDTDIRRCNNLCEFCFVLQMAPKFRRTLYIKDDDYRYSFLFGHYVTLTNLSDHDWWRIENMGLSPLYVSVHVTDTEKRRQFLRNANAPDIIPQLQRLADHDVEVHTQLVIVPEFNDGSWLERSIDELAALWPAVRSVSVVPVGLTAHHKYKMRAHTPAEAAATLDFVEKLQPLYQEKFGVRFVYPTDEWFLVGGRPVPSLDSYDGQALHENGLGMVRHFLDEWADVQQEIDVWTASNSATDLRFSKVTLATGKLFGDTLRETAGALNAQSGVHCEVHEMINFRLGEGITAAGLLMAEDVIMQLNQLDLHEVVILPRVMFDHPETVSLDDLSPAEVASRINRPVALADTMGDVWDVLTGNSKTLVLPLTSP